MEKRMVKILLFATLAFFATTAHTQNGFDFNSPQAFPDSMFRSIGSVPEQNLYVVTPDWSVTVPLQGVTFEPHYFVVNELKWYDFSTYKFKGGGKRAVWIGYAVAGILHGGREAYHAEPTAFEKRFNAAPLSFFGSEQWKRQYFNRDPENQAHKPEVWNSVRDYWHFSHTASATLWVSGAFVLGQSKQPIKYRLLDGIFAGLITSGFASLTYEVLR